MAKKPKPKMKPIELKTPPEQTQTITRVIFDILKEHGPLTITDTWEHVKEVGLRGLSSKRHMKIVMRWMRERQKLRRIYSVDAMHGFIVAVITAAIFGAIGAVVVPSTSCYAFDNTSHIYDFSSLVGQLFEYDDEKDPDLVVRFCKDIETRSQPGYVDFGRFDSLNSFIAGAGHAKFVQEYYNGDLRNCEKTYDKLGRTAQVNIICGNCPNGQCIGGLGCICNVTYESPCRVLIDLALPCVKPGSRVFEGFTVGFHPRSWEVVYNGLTQLGYEKARDEFSFSTEQRDVTLYLTAVASLSNLVQKPTIKISPGEGLDVKLSGSGASGSPPTTLSPTTIIVDWRCEKARDAPYVVEITIPVENYDPIQFTFAKICENSQDERGESMRGWAIFGILSCILIVGLTLSCVGGFIYQTRVRNLRGFDAIPGMALLSACLETASGGGHRYTRPGDGNDPFVNQATWEQEPTSRRTTTTSERTYGSI
ncbi:G-protein coupled receptor [Perilla frutescens var. frutescens]|nr:G-protein coupled receptor [Perilla frutescens var. frutescens]